MAPDSRPATWRTLLAFACVYLLWGSTFLAVRIGVLEVPPFLLAAMRFVVAGAILFGWMIAQGEALPRPNEWASIALLAFMIFVIDYGLVFWAEQTVPSGLAAVMMATTPTFMAASEILLLRTLRLTPRLLLALSTGIVGVAVLMSNSLRLGGAAVDRPGAIALLCAAVSWSMAAVLSRKLALPESKLMSSGAQMLTGGVLLTGASLALGEFGRFHPAAVSAKAWISLAYLIVAGSIVAFTAYVWLIHHHSPMKVGTHAYVNPLVAVIIGYLWGAEELTTRTLMGTLFILIGVVVITTTTAPKPAAAEAAAGR